VFTARYALSPYIKQIRFVFKGLMMKGPLADATDAPQPWGLLCNPMMKMKMMIIFFPSPGNGAPVEWYWQAKTEELREKHVPVPLQQVSRKSTRNAAIMLGMCKSRTCPSCLGAFAELQKATISSSCLSVRLSAGNNSAPAETVFIKFNIWAFFENLSRKFTFDWSLTRITGTLNEDLCICMIISRSVLLRMRNVSDKSCKENQNTHFVFNNFSANRAVYEIIWKNILQPDRQQTTK
jgi:hypothetical protein